MSKFSSPSIISIYQTSIHDKSTPQACSKGNDNKVLHILRSAVDHFADGCRLGVIGQHYRQPKEIFPKFFDKWLNSFPVQIRCMFNGTPIVICVWCTDTDTFDLYIFTQRIN